MTISYNWLCNYLPIDQAGIAAHTVPGELSKILTAIGLEVESLDIAEDIKGGLKGLLVGEVMSCEKHPDADKLKLTTVSVNNGNLLKIVCGAPNVATGQKVIVAPVGTVLYPVNGPSFTIKKSKIRGAESEGMICAEDEIGLGTDHDGIKVLPADSIPGTAVADIYKPKQDHIFEIGLTPNRIDAMSHLGVARDVCAYLSHHLKKDIKPVLPYKSGLTPDNLSAKMEVRVENEDACRRYSGICIKNISITDSPQWMQEKLKSIGVKPINNIVDITNFILHETGQPLHAFDADKIKGNKIIVRTAKDGESFTTLDGKARTLSASDLLICDERDGMCIAGVYGGIHSGVSNETKNIFIESAWFNPAYIRKTSLKHNLRTDAAARFEKGTDISNTVQVLTRAAMLVKELASGEISGEVIDVYPSPLKKTSVGLSHAYLQKLSGKKYPAEAVKQILSSLGFDITGESQDHLVVDVPYSKTDISLPADLVEEIMRIDGLDNIEIPSAITIAPSVEKNGNRFELKDKLAGYLTGLGFHEIFTNSITNSAFYDEEVLQSAVKMINSLSSELNIMRPGMLQGGLQVIAHNNNRKMVNIRMFESGYTYKALPGNVYEQKLLLAFYISGNTGEQHWNVKPAKTDFYYLKGVVENVLALWGVTGIRFEPSASKGFSDHSLIWAGNKTVGFIGEVKDKTLKQFDVKNPVFYAELQADELFAILENKSTRYREISKFPSVIRDLSIVVDKNIPYAQIKKLASSAGIAPLRTVNLFDVFESDKLGAGKKAMAVSFTFMDETKTLTDVEIDGFMQKLIGNYEKELHAEIRK